MLPSFYIQATYRTKLEKDDTITSEFKCAFYTDNYVWCESARLLVVVNSPFKGITYLQIQDKAGMVVLEFSDKLQVEILK